MKGSWGGNKRLTSSAVQSPLGEYTEKQLTGPAFVGIWAPITSRVLVSGKGVAWACRDFFYENGYISAAD